MARYIVDYTYPSGLLQNDQPTWDSHLANLRDRFRNVLPAPYVVSDIFTWQGTTATRIGYGFIVRNGDQEWLIAFGYGVGASGTSVNVTNWFNSSQPTINSNFVGSTASFSLSHQAPSLTHYNCRLGSYGVSWDDPNAMTFVGGDFTVSSVNPWTNYAGFMPSGVLPGHSHTLTSYGSTSTFSGVTRYFFLFDDVNETLTTYYTDTLVPSIKAVVMQGAIYDPFSSDDVNREGFYLHSLTASVSSGITTNGVVSFFYDPDNVNNIAAAESESQVIFQPNYTYLNLPRNDGSWPSSRTAISGTSAFKGWIRAGLSRSIGDSQLNTDYYRLYDSPDGPLVKLHRYVAYPWIENTPPPPYPESQPVKGFKYQ